jgi:hypothetical protein
VYSWNASVSKVHDTAYETEHENNKAPLAMLAFASLVVEKIIRPNNGAAIKDHFKGLSMTVPSSKRMSGPTLPLNHRAAIALGRLEEDVWVGSTMSILQPSPPY